MAKGIFPLLNVSNLDKTLEWYKGLGIKSARETTAGMTWGTVTSGDVSLILYPKDATPTIEQPADTQAWLSGELGKGVMLNVGVPNAEKTWAKAQAMRADVDSPLANAPWGGKEFSLTDPDGYVVAFSDKFPVDTAKPKRRAGAGRATGAKAGKRGGKAAKGGRAATRGPARAGAGRKGKR